MTMSYATKQFVYRQRSRNVLAWVVVGAFVVGAVAVAGLLSLDLASPFTLALQVP
jgi:RsiW-degrading membrane proteinase PrsW (M82 family)